MQVFSAQLKQVFFPFVCDLSIYYYIISLCTALKNLFCIKQPVLILQFYQQNLSFKSLKIILV